MKKTFYHHNSSRGSITLPILIGIVILGSIYLVGGILPNLEPIDTGEQGRVVVLDPENTDNASDSSSLRLRTIKFKTCDETAAVDLQLDITGSLSPVAQDLKDAVFTFTEQLTDNSIIGIQAYNEDNPRMEVIPISEYKDVKNDIRPAVQSLKTNGGTPSYDALNYSKEILQTATTQHPDRQFTYIFFSDGNPNIGPRDVESIRQAAQGIKDLGVTVYAIGLKGDSGLDERIIQAIASDPSKAIVTTNSDDLERIYSEIRTVLCQPTS